MKKNFILMVFVIILSLFWFITGCNDEKCVVSFETNGGSSINNVEVVKGDLVKKPQDPTKRGFTFIDWYKDVELNEVYSFDTKVEENLELYAKWEELQKFSISFETNGGSFIKSTEVYVGEMATRPNNPTKEGFVFGNWYKDSEFKELYEFNTSVESNLTLYASWDSAKPIANVFILGVEKPTNWLLFANNKKEQTNKRVEFMDRGNTYLVGDDNNFSVMPVTDFVDSNYDPVSVDEWLYDITLYLKNESDFLQLPENNEYVDSIDYKKCLINFSEVAINQTFKVKVFPKGLTAKQLLSVDDYTIEFEFDVIDGFNVYTAKDLAYMDDRKTDGEYNKAWSDFKKANGIDENLKPSCLILQNNLFVTSSDLPKEFFYQEGDSDVSDQDDDYPNIVGTMRDYAFLYYKELSENEKFSIKGNYFKIDTSSLDVVIRENGNVTPEGTVISHSTLFYIYGNETNEASISDLQFLGNAPRVENAIKAGGHIILKVTGPKFEAYNTISSCSFITFFPNYTSSEFKMTKCKAYDAFNSFVYNWGSDKVYIDQCEMIGAGGPVIIQDHVDSTNDDGGRIAKTYITNSKLESYVAGSEGWFSVVQATSVVPLIKSLNAAFVPFNKTFLKEVENSQSSDTESTITLMNLICVNKSGESQGLTASKIKGELKIDELSSFNFGEDNPYLKGMQDLGYTAGAPVFQSSDGGFGLFDGSKLVDVSNNPITDPSNPMYSGDYLCLYYQGMAITLGYFDVEK